MSDHDKLHRFIFDHCDIRGEIITLADSYRAVLDNHNYPAPIQQLLGQFLAAAGLLSATLKFDGILTLQARGNGPLSLLMADCTRQHNLRAIAEFDAEYDYQNDDLASLIGSGQLAITIDPSKGQRYQGIVPLEKHNLAACLEDYFNQSEQLPTRIWLSADGKQAGGLFLQALPRQLEADENQNAKMWEHLTSLADTIKPEEQLGLAHSDQLFRLFHQDNVRMFPATNLQFACSCSEERTTTILKSMNRTELEQIIEEQGLIEVSCHFCNQLYRFGSKDIDRLFDGEPPAVH